MSVYKHLCETYSGAETLKNSLKVCVISKIMVFLYQFCIFKHLTYTTLFNIEAFNFSGPCTVERVEHA